ncbi:hypothetical protein LY90DRAFT_708660 [Neocallimastix californiae]|jgi:Na+/melibiose symporter-like transporter|uniref:Sugar/Na+ simporter n=1 Tax=Neocallimastix californiae TaxID=1754190 RepID=A0A1Y1ZSX1_9FUNG|nr:hypothetical protein LY90DRAFT_708660 [Neocallimastix californiae]|eukprot:ORY13324.1 hypothetical protein LY90DRAFT_708660 [Neocallimastix californiae]
MEENKEQRGFYKLSWLQRIGYASGDLAQNFIYQTISQYILIFYTDVYLLGGDPSKTAGLASTMLFVVRFIDLIWDPIVGALVDKKNPRWGKYRSYLIFGGLPLSIFSILCFYDGFKPSILYAYITYIGLSMLYTLVNVPYGALNSSLTRDTDEVTILTTTRMFFANIGGFCVGAGVPIIVALFAGKKVPYELVFFQGIGSLPSFIFLPLIPVIKSKVGKKNMFYLFITIAIFGMAMLYVVSRYDINKYIVLIYIAQFIKGTGLTVAGGYAWVLVPEVISYGEYKTGRRISGIVNSLTGIFYRAGVVIGGLVPGKVLDWTNYKAPDEEETNLPNDSRAWFWTIFIYSVVGFFLLVFCFIESKERVVMKDKEEKNVKFSDLWVEFIRNRPLRVVALYFITSFTLGNINSASGAYLMNNLEAQSSSAQEGIRWLVSVIPAALLILEMIIISRYELTDEKIDEINMAIENNEHIKPESDITEIEVEDPNKIEKEKEKDINTEKNKKEKDISDIEANDDDTIDVKVDK